MSGFDFLSPLIDKAERDKFKTLSSFLENSPFPWMGPETHGLIMNEVVTSITQQIEWFGKLQYSYIGDSSNWFNAGEQRVAISFCRDFLKIPASREVNQQDADIFREQIEHFRENNCIPPNDLNEMLCNPKLNLFGQRIDAKKDKQINAILEFLNIPYRYLYMTRCGTPSMLFGKVMRHWLDKVLKGYEVLVMDEIARTPGLFLGNAGWSFEKFGLVREQSLLTILHNKWISHFETSEFEKSLLDHHDYSRIREKIKEKAMAAFGVRNQNQFLARKDEFLALMRDQTCIHELAHHINTYADMPEQVYAAGRWLDEDNGLNALKEAMTDWAGEMNEKAMGPILYSCKVAETNPGHAETLLFQYLSDYWFLDAYDFDEAFSPLTDIVVPFILQFLKPGKDIPWSRIRSEQARIYSWQKDRVLCYSRMFLRFFQESTFKVDGVIMTYAELEEELISFHSETELNEQHSLSDQKGDFYRENLRNEKLGVERKQEILEYSGFYVNVADLLKKFNPGRHDLLRLKVNQMKAQIERDVLRFVKGNEGGKKGETLREWLVRNMNEFLWKDKKQMVAEINKRRRQSQLKMGGTPQLQAQVESFKPTRARSGSRRKSST